MKKITVFIISICLLQIGLISGSQARDEVTDKIHFSFQTEEPHFLQEHGFTTILTKEDTVEAFMPGFPNLPVIRKKCILPFGSTIDSFSFNGNNVTWFETQTPVKPYQTPLPQYIQQQSTPVYTINNNVYNQDILYPDNPFIVTTYAGQHQGDLKTIVIIDYYPVRYSPADQKVCWTECSDITLFIQQPIKKSVEASDSYDLVVICPDSFTQEIQPLVDHKEECGVSTTIMTTEEIYGEYQGRDPAEKIKYYIFDVVKNQGVKYVLLVGNVNKLPMRESAIEFYNSETIITDLYYADVIDGSGNFASWDSNGNNRFSEYNWNDGPIDMVDAHPDVFVGRLPCSDVGEVKIVVDKIITYETSSAGQSWFDRIILMGGDTFPNHGVLEGELVTDLIKETMSTYQFEPVTLWTSKDTFNPLTINREMNKGAGFISYSGHGYEQGFGTSPPNQEERIQYYSPYLYGLFNGDKLPVIFFDACSTTKLDFTVEDALYWYPEPLARFFTFLEGEEFNMETLFPCFSWQLVKKGNGGSIASIGATRVAFTGVDEDGPHWGAGYLNSRFFSNYVPGITLGELFTSSQIDYLQGVGKELITLEEFNLIGDPSLKIGGYI